MVTRQHVLVTGAGGFVCSAVAVALAEAGHAVLAFDQHFDAPTRARLSQARPGGIDVIEGDLTGALAQLSARPDCVIHGAAITSDPRDLGLSRAGHLRSNMELLTATLDAARKSGASRFVFLSSMGVFAPDDRPTSPDGRLTEATPPTACNPYATAKRAGEIVTQAAAEDGFATLSLRLGNVFGPHEAVRETRQILCLAARMAAEARDTGLITAGTPAARREWAWLPDLAGSIARLAITFGTAAPPVLHAGAPPVLTDLDLARALAEAMPGTTIRLAQPPHAAIRPPMGTMHAHAAPPNDGTTAGWPQTRWKGLPEALARLVSAAEAPA